MVDYLRVRYSISQRRACRLVFLPRSVYTYQSHLNPRTEIRQRMREIVQVRVRYGYRRVHVLLRREGH